MSAGEWSRGRPGPQGDPGRAAGSQWNHRAEDPAQLPRGHPTQTGDRCITHFTVSRLCTCCLVCYYPVPSGLLQVPLRLPPGQRQPDSLQGGRPEVRDRRHPADCEPGRRQLVAGGAKRPACGALS